MDDGLLMLKYASAAISAADGASTWPAYLAAAPADPPQVAEWPRLHFLAAVLLPDFRWYARGHFRALAQNRLAAIALATADFAQRNGGQSPATLAELVPTYLPYVPYDPMATDACPLRMTPGAAPGSVALYSVGDDGVDDAGSDVAPDRQPADNAGRTWGSWNRRDFVVRVNR
jgi:hypothetical protein